MKKFGFKEYQSYLERLSILAQKRKGQVKEKVIEDISQNIHVLKELEQKIKDFSKCFIESLTTQTDKLIKSVQEEHEKCQNILRDANLPNIKTVQFQDSFSVHLDGISLLWDGLAALVSPSIVLDHSKIKLNDKKSTSISPNDISQKFKIKAEDPGGISLMSFGEKTGILHYVNTKNIIVEWDYLRKKYSAEYKGHKDIINAIALNHKETVLASGSFDCFILLWDLENKCLQGKVSYVCHINLIQFTNDDKFFLTSSPEKNINVWNLDTKKLSYQFKHSSDVVSAFCLSPKNDFLAIGANVLKIINYKTKLLEHTLSRVRVKVDEIRISNESEYLIYSDVESIKIWHFASDTLRNLAIVNVLINNKVSFTFSEELALIGFISLNYCNYSFINIADPKYNPISFNFTNALIYKNIIYSNHFIIYSPAYGFLISSLEQKNPKSFGGHISKIQGARLSGNEKVIITFSSDLCARVWCAISGQEKYTILLANRATTVGIDYNGDLVAVGIGREATVWRLVNFYHEDVEAKQVNRIFTESEILSIGFLENKFQVVGCSSFSFIIYKFPG